MSEELQVIIAGSSTEFSERLQRLPRSVSAHVIAVIQRLTITLQGHVKQSYLSGDPLNVRTGRLRRSITQKVEVKGEPGKQTIRGIVGTNVEYAAVHELGFNGTVQVPAHTRRVRSRDVYTVAGVAGRRGTRAKKVMSAQGFAFVRAHSMHMRIPARPFLAPALNDMQSSIHQGLRAALDYAVRESRRGN